MYVNEDNFEKWMLLLSKKLNEIGKDLKASLNTNEVLDNDEKLLDNQDLAFMLKVSYRTLQRYRSLRLLPYAQLRHKIYYRVSDVRDFIRKYCDVQTFRKFEKENPESEDS